MKRLISIVPEYPLSLMSGGTLVQAVETFEALRRATNEYEFELFEWNRPTPADLYHFIGLPRYLTQLAELVREKKRPYVLTLLAGGETQTFWPKLREKVRSKIVRSAGLDKTVQRATAVVVITPSDQGWIRRRYHLPHVECIHNGVAEGFAHATPELWHARFPARDFLLCVGALQPRKGQLILVEAANRLQIPVVVIGPTLPGHSIYAGRVRKAMETNLHYGGLYIEGLPPKDALLASAYAACRGYALLSARETEPLSVLEALAARKPVLLARAAYTKNPPFNLLPAVASLDPAPLISALRSFWERLPRPIPLPPEHTWDFTARSLLEVYRRFLG